MQSMLAASLGTGPGWYPLLLLYMPMLPFYLAQWAEYHTGQLDTAAGWCGVTEGQYTSIFLHFVAAWRGAAAWHGPLASVLPAGALPAGPLRVWASRVRVLDVLVVLSALQASWMGFRMLVTTLLGPARCGGGGGGGAGRGLERGGHADD